MADFTVNLEQMATSVNDMKNISKRLSGISQDVSSVFAQTRKSVTMKLAQNLQRAAVCSSINNCAEDFNKLSVGLQQGVQFYRDTEKRLDSSNTKNFKTVLSEVTEVISEAVKMNSVHVFLDALEQADGFMGFNIERTDEYTLVLERDRHLALDLCDIILSNEKLVKALGIHARYLQGCSIILEDVSQKIILDFTPNPDSDGHFNNTSDMSGEASFSWYNIEYISEGTNYKGNFLISVVDAKAEGESKSLFDWGWLSPVTATSMLAGGTVAAIKTNIRVGTEDEYIKIGLNGDVLTAGVEATQGIGTHEFTDAAGETQTGTGIFDTKRLSASVVDGRAYIQTKFCGVEDTLALTGSVEGTGGAGSVAITDNGYVASLDAELIAGIGLAFSRIWGD